LFHQKISNQHLVLENPPRVASAESVNEQSVARKLADDRRRKMSAKKMKQRHWNDLKASKLDYESFLPLHELWKQYMDDCFSEEVSRCGIHVDENFDSARFSFIFFDLTSYLSSTGIELLMRTEFRGQIIMVQSSQVSHLPLRLFAKASRRT
jgi:hypothetical protein